MKKLKRRKRNKRSSLAKHNHLLLHLILQGVFETMANFEDLKAKLSGIAAGVDSLEAKIAELKAAVAAGQVISQEQLDELDALAGAIGSDIADDSDQQ